MEAETVDVIYRGLALAKGARWIAAENKIELDAPMPVGTMLVLTFGDKATAARVTKVVELERASVIVALTGEITDVASASATAAVAAPPPASAPAARIATQPPEAVTISMVADSGPIPTAVPDSGSDAQTTMLVAAPGNAALPAEIETDPAESDASPEAGGDKSVVDIKSLEPDDGGGKKGKRKRRHTLIGR